MTQQKKIVKTLTLREISGVTIPAQSPALVAIMKSTDNAVVEELAKYLSTTEGAQSFDAYMSDTCESNRKWAAQEAVWPLLNAFNNSVSSIVADETLLPPDRQGKIAESVAQFLTAMQSPEVGGNTDDITKLFETVKENATMSEELKKANEGLTAQVAELTKQLAELSVLAKFSDAEKAFLAKADKSTADKFKDASDEERKETMEKAASADAVFKSVTGVEIRKSEVGSGVFELLKAQDAEIVKGREAVAKAAEVAETAELTKAAEAYQHLPGTVDAKVALLKAAKAFPDAVAQTFNELLKAANSGLSGAFVERGTSHSETDIHKAAKVEALVKQYKTEHPGTSDAVATTAVYHAHPELYEG